MYAQYAAAGLGPEGVLSRAEEATGFDLQVMDRVLGLGIGWRRRRAWTCILLPLPTLPLH